MVKWFHSRDMREVPFAIVLLIEFAALASAALAPQHWLRAVGVMSMGMATAGLLRLLLSNEQAGLLRVRRRNFDVSCYWALGVLAITIGLKLHTR
jgi:hypothetical protein